MFLGLDLGTTNVKAVVVKGAAETEVADKAALKALLQERRPRALGDSGALA